MLRVIRHHFTVDVEEHFDADQPRFAVPALTRVRHYGGLGGMWGRLLRLLEEFRLGKAAAV